jgi:hypothetical protein
MIRLNMAPHLLKKTKFKHFRACRREKTFVKIMNVKKESKIFSLQTQNE